MIFTNNLNPEINLGLFSIRWYGLLFAIGIALNYIISSKIFKKEGYGVEKFESMVLYLFIGLVVGARLGHVIFYEWDYYSKHLLEILFVWKGGLASHGATIGLVVAYAIWCKVHKAKFHKFIDAIVIAIPISAGFVRLGNFFNSEIVGKKTNGEWGVVFERLGEDFPRHPSQFYESIIGFSIFAILFFLYKKYYKKTPQGFYFYLFLILYFGSRFVVEFWKERQTLSYDFPLSMGQVLSILPFLIGVSYFIFFYPKLKKRKS